jgi:hypothetical protein
MSTFPLSLAISTIIKEDCCMRVHGDMHQEIFPVNLSRERFRAVFKVTAEIPFPCFPKVHHTVQCTFKKGRSIL